MPKFEFVSAAKKDNIESAVKFRDGVYVEEKYDGSRFGLEKDNTGWRALSRGGIDRAKNIPYIIEQLERLNLPVGTVLDCEVIVMHPDRKLRWELSRSVMGTKGYNPEAAEATLMIFDIQHLGDVSFMTTPYFGRRKALRGLFPPVMESEDTYFTHGCLAIPKIYKREYMQSIWDMIVTEGNGEGLMLKQISGRGYGKDWIKVKKEHTIDAFVLGAVEGKGKYEGQIGTVELAVYNKDTIWPIGKISNVGTDQQRREMTDLALAKQLKNKVMEVKFNEVTKGKKLRHGRFVRWRDDKPKEDCLLGQLDEKS